MIDKHSATWREIAAWAEAALSRDCERIETFMISPEETAALRGSIFQLRELLALPEEPEQRVVEPTEGYGFQSAD